MTDLLRLLYRAIIRCRVIVEAYAQRFPRLRILLPLWTVVRKIFHVFNLLLLVIFDWLRLIVPRALKIIRGNLIVSAVVLAGFTISVLLLATPKPKEIPPADPPPQERETIKIGALISLTGDHVQQGTEMYRGYQLALKAINAQGVYIKGIPHTLELIIYDDESSPVRVIEVANLMVDRDRPLALLGPYSSRLTSRLLPISRAPRDPAGGADCFCRRPRRQQGRRIHHADPAI